MKWKWTPCYYCVNREKTYYKPEIFNLIPFFLENTIEEIYFTKYWTFFWINDDEGIMERMTIFLNFFSFLSENYSSFCNVQIVKVEKVSVRRLSLLRRLLINLEIIIEIIIKLSNYNQSFREYIGNLMTRFASLGMGNDTNLVDASYFVRLWCRQTAKAR